MTYFWCGEGIDLLFVPGSKVTSFLCPGRNYLVLICMGGRNILDFSVGD